MFRSLPSLLLALTALALAHPRAIAQQAGDPQDAETVIFSADEVTRAVADGPIVAKGSVEAYYQGRRVAADELVWDPATGVVTAIGSVAVTDPDGTTAFADRIDLTEDFGDALARSFSALLADNGRIAAARAVRQGGRRNELDYAVYSACEVCDENGEAVTPTWRVKALRVTQDVERKVIRYRHAILEIKGVPVLYAPYFQMPDPSVERQSGFLIPNIGGNGRIGLFTEIPYYFALSSHYDATLSPKVTEEDGVLWQGEYRHRTRRGQIAVQAGVLDYEPDLSAATVDESPSTRWHYFARGHYDLPADLRFDLDVERVSDDTYLRRYDVRRTGAVAPEDGLRITNRLRSIASVSRSTDEGYIDIDTILFEGLRLADDADLTPLAAPKIDIVQRFDPPLIGGDGRLQLSGVNLQRPEGADTRRWSGSALWTRSFFGLGGQKVTLTGDLRGDLYFQENLDLGVESGVLINDETDNTVGRFAPTAAIDWSYPFIRVGSGATIIVEPRVQLVASGVTEEEDDILNEDSQSIEFDTTNLFVLNKSPGFDVFEEGERANVGLTVSADFGGGVFGRATVGQQFRIREANDFAPENGLDGRRSNIVSGFELDLRQWLSASARVRFDERTGRIERNEASLSTRFGPFSGSANYARLLQPADPDTGVSAIDEAITANFNVNVYKGWRVFGATQERLNDSDDLTGDANLTGPVRRRVGVGYRDDCASFELVYQREFVRDRDLEPTTTILFTFSLNTVGG
ncbi:MAG: LPS assembly protein LptD [Pseudomonadota bacterium]